MKTSTRPRSLGPLGPALLLAALVPGAACGPRPLHRFGDRRVLWVDDDRRDVPRPPAVRPWSDGASLVRIQIAQPLDRLLGVRPRGPARNVNARAEVPDGAWFTNRNHRRPLSRAEMRRGANRDDGPSVLAPWRVVGAGTDRAGRYLDIVDERRRRYRLRFDAPGWPYLATASALVAGRLLHALGYHVPPQHLVFVLPAELVVSPRAKLPRGALGRLLGPVPRQRDGSLRAVAIPAGMGRALGPWRFAGRRGDDPNDRIPHQDRRELRGFLPVAALLNLTRPERVARDVYVRRGGRRYVQHYLWDLTSALGSDPRGRPKPVDDGYAARFDAARLLFRAVYPGGVGGASYRRWRRRRLLRRYPALGWLDERRFVPRSFTPRHWPAAFAHAEARDLAWGARLVASLRRPQVAAAVSAAGLPPAVARRLVRVLWSRRRAVLRAWLGVRAPLGEFSARGGRLCFTDLWTRAGLAAKRRSRPTTAARPRYRFRLYSDAGEIPGFGVVSRRRGDRVCAAFILARDRRLPADDRYRVVAVSRPGVTTAPVRVHLRPRSGGLGFRIMGLGR